VGWIFIELLLGLAGLPLCLYFLYLANFQTTVTRVGKRLAPGEVLVPDDIRRAITPKYLSLLLWLTLCSVVAIFAVSILFARWLVLILLVLGMYGFMEATAWLDLPSWVPASGDGYYVGHIRDELEGKRKRYLALGHTESAARMAELKANLDSLRDRNGSIAKKAEGAFAVK
jgi:hypothetical protein